jgi:hypothetical protein
MHRQRGAASGAASGQATGEHDDGFHSKGPWLQRQSGTKYMHTMHTIDIPCYSSKRALPCTEVHLSSRTRRRCCRRLLTARLLDLHGQICASLHVLTSPLLAYGRETYLISASSLQLLRD